MQASMWGLFDRVGQFAKSHKRQLIAGGMVCAGGCSRPPLRARPTSSSHPPGACYYAKRMLRSGLEELEEIFKQQQDLVMKQARPPAPSCLPPLISRSSSGCRS